jgi:Ca-activated chloride channel family protein
MRKPSLVAMLVLALVSVVLAQDPQRMFRSGVQTVPIYATVLDANGRLMPDLKEEDFQVFDNLKPAAITLFDTTVQPIAVIVDLDMSGSMINAMDRTKDAAEAFLLRLLPRDRAMLASFDDKIIMSPQFSSNRDELVRFLRTGLQYGNGTRLWDAVDRSVAILKEEPERKVVLVLSDGEDSSSHTNKDDVLSRAQESHVMVYAIGIRNRYRGGPNGEFVISQPDRFLKKLTAETGGGNFEVAQQADLNSTFTRVADELHRQYLIGISPATLDGKLHKLEVKVKVPGMTVRARQSYMASKEAPEPRPSAASR